MSITLRQLEVFVAVAREGNVTRAAETLRLSQSAVSMSLAELERILGGKLFDRWGKRLLVNDQGRALIPRADAVLSRVEEIEGTFGDPERRLAGLLRIGASSSIGNYLLPRLLGNFAAGFSETQLSLEVGNTEQVIQELLRFQTDIGFIEGFCHRPEIEVTPWRPDDLAIHVGAKHPMARKGDITPEDLGRERWILREQGSGTREVFESALARAGHEIEVFLELGNTEAIKEAVEAGLGISCLPIITTRRARESGVLVPLRTPFLDLRRHFYLLVHRDKYRTTLLRRFISFCETYSETDP